MKKKLLLSIVLIMTGVSIMACGDKKLRNSAGSSKEEASVSEESKADVEASKEEPAPEPTLEPTPAPTEEPLVKAEDYLTSDIKAVVDSDVYLGYYDMDCENAGKSFSFSELTDYLCNNEEARIVKPTIFSYVLENDESSVLLIKYLGMDIYSEGDDSFVVVSVSVGEDGTYHIAGSVSSWCRSEVDMRANGTLFTDGSGGAGDHFMVYSYFAEDGSVKPIYSAEECFPGWISGLFEFSDSIKFSQKTIDAAIALDNAGMNGSSDATTYTTVTLYKLDKKLYGILQSTGMAEEDPLVTSAEQDGLNWVDYVTIETYTKDFMKQNGISEDDSQINWVKVK